MGDPKGFIHFMDCKHHVLQRKIKHGGHQLIFYINGVKYTLDPADYIVPLRDNSGQCFFGVAFLEGDEGVAILGDVFLRKYYTAFRYDQSGEMMVGIQHPDAAARATARFNAARNSRARSRAQIKKSRKWRRRGRRILMEEDDSKATVLHPHPFVRRLMNVLSRT